MAYRPKSSVMAAGSLSGGATSTWSFPYACRSSHATGYRDACACGTGPHAISTVGSAAPSAAPSTRTPCGWMSSGTSAASSVRSPVAGWRLYGVSGHRCRSQNQWKS